MISTINNTTPILNVISNLITVSVVNPMPVVNPMHSKTSQIYRALWHWVYHYDWENG